MAADEGATAAWPQPVEGPSQLRQPLLQLEHGGE